MNPFCLCLFAELKHLLKKKTKPNRPQQLNANFIILPLIYCYGDAQIVLGK